MLLRGRHGTYGTGLVRWHAWSALVASDVAVFCAACVALGDIVGNAGVSCVAGMALGDIDLHSVWQALALGDIDLHFVWHAWHLWHWAGSCGALGSRLSPWTPQLFAWQAWHLAFTLFGRRGAWRHQPSLCVADVALMALGWLWWRVVVDAAAVCVASVAFGASTSIRCGRGATWWHRPCFCVAGVALGGIDLQSVWQASHLATMTFTCMAGVALVALVWRLPFTSIHGVGMSAMATSHDHPPLIHSTCTYEYGW